MRKADFKNIKLGKRVRHPIYGLGNIIKPATAPFVYVLFDKSENPNHQVLAVSQNVLTQEG